MQTLSDAKYERKGATYLLGYGVLTERELKQLNYKIISTCHVKYEHQTLVKSSHVLALNNVIASLVQLRMQSYNMAASSSGNSNAHGNTHFVL